MSPSGGVPPSTGAPFGPPALGTLVVPVKLTLVQPVRVKVKRTKTEETSKNFLLFENFIISCLKIKYINRYIIKIRKKNYFLQIIKVIIKIESNIKPIRALKLQLGLI
jgi:hypothetical protein